MLCKIKPVLTADQKENRTLLFAAKELQKYLRMVVSEEAPVMSCASFKAEEGTIFIGIDLKDNLPEVPNKDLDDAICIDVENFSGVITGNNARAVLIAAYRFLREKGYKFIRPGKDGETVPETVDGKKVYVCEKASYRHRCICIEGGVFQEELCDMIDWLPKVSMNEYFVQFRLPREFFNRWYSSGNPYRQDQELTDEEIAAMTIDAEDEIAKRGIMYYKVGHGWTCEAVGLPGTVFGSVDIKPNEEQKSKMALINGKRDLFENSPINTNLCYSRQDVRDSMTDSIVKYCEENPHVDYVYFSLADGRNNHCECEDCKSTIPSDYLAMMLNDIDKKLTEKGIDTKIVFPLYYDLLWKPEKEKIINTDRFIISFSPISRSYTYSYNANDSGTLKPFVRNNLDFPKTVGDCVEYLRDWQKDFDGECLIFEYHLVGDQYFEFPQQEHAKVMYKDIKEVEKFGLTGWISCQIHRTFTPTALGMNILAETLWNKEKPFEEIEENVFKAQFGEKWQIVKDYLDSLTENGYDLLTRREEILNETSKSKLKKSLDILEKFKPQIEAGLKTEHKLNWKVLNFHSELHKMLLEYFMTFGSEESKRLKEEIIDFVYKNEEEYKDVFDSSYFVYTFEGMGVNLK